MPVSRKTQGEIDAEIAALAACKAYAPRHSYFGDDNHAKIDLQIKYLRGEIAVTCDEWHEFTEEDQGVILEAQAWADGHVDERPSAGWESFKQKDAQ